MTTETASTTDTSPAELANKGFKYLCGVMNQRGREAQLSVISHVRAVTGNQYASIANYHADAAITAEDKQALYRYCIGNIAMPDGKIKFPLKGSVGAGDKREPTAPAAVPEPAAEPTPIEVLPPESKGAPTKRAMKPATEESSDPLFEQLASRISRYITATSNPVDEAAVEKIADTAASKRLDTFIADNLHDAIKSAVSNGAFPTAKVKEMFDKLSKDSAHRIEFVTDAGEVKALAGIVHPQVTQLATWLRAGVPVWAWSAAGSGKTHMSRQIAELLGVTPYVMSVDPTITVSKIMGYRNVANGDFIPGFAYPAFKDGGLLAMDEIDTGDPGVIASANAMLSNTHYLFPNAETVERNPRFHCLAMANTKGMGAVAGYTARNKLDAATLDRFAIIEIKYDAGVELALSCGEGAPAAPWKPSAPASQPTQKAYVQWVQKVREQCGNSVLISPRASINGCKALRAGVPMSEVVDALVFKLTVDDTKKRILDTCGLPKI